MLLWLSCRAGLTISPTGLPRSNAVADRLKALAGEIDRAGRDAVGAALDRLIASRADRFAGGLETYRRHPYRRPAERWPVIWRCGSARLLDCGDRERSFTGATVLIVPSLINRHYILDLRPQRSFVRYLACHGIRPLLFDWGEPGRAERGFCLADYIAGPLEAALVEATAHAKAPVAVCGYCMGGLLTLALAMRRPTEVAKLVLMATPWDFHAERRDQAMLLNFVTETLARLPNDAPLPVEAIQTLFLALDPFLAERKFTRFAGFDPGSEDATAFVALEDWINDGVPLARRVALECAQSWYRDNDPLADRWRVSDRAVRPAEIELPALVVLPSRDRIVPPASAEPLAQRLPRAHALRPPLGHIGMMTATAAPRLVWQPIAEWLHRAA